MTLKQDIAADSSQPLAPLMFRSAIGGALMGLANLVPGISGGTMLLAAGIYPRFITAVAEVSRMKFRPRSLAVLCMVGATALVAIVMMAGIVRTLMVEHRWTMYSLFIGLTLGGVPVVWSLARPARRATWVGAAIGFGCMAVLAWAQTTGAGADGDGRTSIALMFVAGVAAAAAMILPGVSGGYLLLVLGVYIAILGAIESARSAAMARDLVGLTDPFVYVVLPVGLGVLVGVATVSNLLRWLMNRFEKTTLGVLLGLLVGAVVGLWPFQRGVRPEVGDVIRGRVMTVEMIETMDPGKYPTVFFTPTFGQWLTALLLAAIGFAATSLLARIGRGKKSP